MHAIRVLREDHERIWGLLDASSGDDPTRFERLEREITVHLLAEDNVFLPQVEDAVEDTRKATGEFFDGDVLSGATEKIAAAYDNHREIGGLLAESPEATDGLRTLLKRHVEIEEEIFPSAEEVLEEEDFERIGDLIEHCKWQVRGLAQARLASSSGFRPPRRREPRRGQDGQRQEIGYQEARTYGTHDGRVWPEAAPTGDALRGRARLHGRGDLRGREGEDLR